MVWTCEQDHSPHSPIPHRAATILFAQISGQRCGIGEWNGVHMGKLPAFQFYPADWRKDPGVQALNYHDRGVWHEILCLMHESERRGVLLLNGKAMPEEALARMLGIDPVLLKQSLTTILSYGVAELEPETGALLNRRMVKDEMLRQVRIECGKLGGNPALLNQNPTTGDNQNPTPSSSSSISSIPASVPLDPVAEIPKRRKDPSRENTGEHQELIRHFCEAWKRQHGTDYPFQPMDARKLKDVRSALGGSLPAAKMAVDRYIATDDEFVRKQKHPTSLLASQLAKFTATASRPRYAVREDN